MSIEITCPTCETDFEVPCDGDWNCPNCWTLWRIEIGLTKVRERNSMERLASGTCRLRLNGYEENCPTHHGIEPAGRRKWCQVCSARANLSRGPEPGIGRLV